MIPPLKNKSIGLISLGCAKNLVDSEVLMKQLESSKFQILFEPETLQGIDTIIINTCGFISDAKQESVDTILHYAEAKRAGNINRLFLMGCLTERYRQELTLEIPEADGVFGVNELPEILHEVGGEYRHNLLGERTITTPSHYAYLKIAEGCDRTCSFCAIPMIRGAHKSKAMEEIIAEATYLAGAGVKELLVISQDTTFYGLDLYGRRRLADLLRGLAAINGIEWIRIHYTYPHAFPLEVLDVIRDHPNICNYIDIPLQHINNRILRSMKRGMTGDKTRKLLETIRKTIPGVTIRTTFITGYPGETGSDFDELCRFVESSRFDRLGVFTYSHEEGTPAFKLRDTLPSRIKSQRQAHLMKIQEQISLERNQHQVGKEIKVLVDREEEEFWVGRSEADSPEVDQEILIKKSASTVNAGNFHQVRITEARFFDLLGEISG
ncbi:MAG: 30S ribosomal protein S12 methylthiotransferase RimO [Bacteroidales bacterium]|nr:30S ribosomal protein S12 methylthiotransferase RimO [Bacteroidales bacterium]